MNVISGYGNEGKVLKVNLSKTPKGIKNTGSNRAGKFVCSHKDIEAKWIKVIEVLIMLTCCKILCLFFLFLVWEDEAWIKENGTEAPASFAVGTEGGASENQ